MEPRHSTKSTYHRCFCPWISSVSTRKWFIHAAEPPGKGVLNRPTGGKRAGPRVPLRGEVFLTSRERAFASFAPLCRDRAWESTKFGAGVELVQSPDTQTGVYCMEDADFEQRLAGRAANSEQIRFSTRERRLETGKLLLAVGWPGWGREGGWLGTGFRCHFLPHHSLARSFLLHVMQLGRRLGRVVSRAFEYLLRIEARASQSSHPLILIGCTLVVEPLTCRTDRPQYQSRSSPMKYIKGQGEEEEDIHPGN